MEAEKLKVILSTPFKLIPEVINSGILIEKGKAVLYGIFKSGKSTLLQYVGMCCAGGLPLFNQYKTKKVKVLYLQLEMPYFAFLKRLQNSSLSQLPDVQDNFHVWTAFWLKVDKPEGRETFEQVIQEIQPELLIIDPLYKVMSGSENSVEDMTKIFDVLDLLIDKYNFALIFSSQGRKTQILEKLGKIDLGDEELRGSSSIPGWVDSILGLRYAADTKRTLSFNLRHGDKERFTATIQLDKKTGLYGIV